MPVIADNATSAVQLLLQKIRHDGLLVDPITDKTSIGSNFGLRARRTVELIADGFVLENPRARLTKFTNRPLNIAFAIANFLWTIRGDDELAMIEFYNDRAKAFSSDGSHLLGAVGKRIFSHEGVDQFHQTLRRLGEDRQSRRAVMQIFLPADLLSPPLDTPCSISFQLLIRNNRLVWITYMRSQSAAMVLPYDLFLFTMLQEAAAIELGVPLGCYHHVCGSLHYYDDEEALVEAMIAEDTSALRARTMQPMDRSPFTLSDELRTAEEVIASTLSSDPDGRIDLRSFGLTPYWEGLLAALLVEMRRRLRVEPATTELDLVAEALRIET